MIVTWVTFGSIAIASVVLTRKEWKNLFNDVGELPSYVHEISADLLIIFSFVYFEFLLTAIFHLAYMMIYLSHRISYDLGK